MKNYLLLCLILSLACQSTRMADKVTDRYAHIDDMEARKIIKSSIENAGGIDAWEHIKRFKYSKNFSLLHADGSVQIKYEQVHEYKYNPLSIDIMSIENSHQIRTKYEGGKYSRTKDGTAVDIETKSLMTSINTSTYVIGMPFKLLDPGAAISYEGEERLENGKQVHVLKVSYNPEKHPNHSTADVWKYYFDKEDYKIVGNWVMSSDHGNIIENLSFTRVGGVLLNTERKSYRLDDSGKKDYLRAHYYYDNYVIE